MEILVDSSVWIEAARKKSPYSQVVSEMLLTGKLLSITKLIQTEVCQGAKTQEQFVQLMDAFLGLKFLQITDEVWDKSAWNFFQCKKKGITVSTTDCLIATTSLVYKTQLFTLDKDFLKMNAVLDLNLYQI